MYNKRNAIEKNKYNNKEITIDYRNKGDIRMNFLAL